MKVALLTSVPGNGGSAATAFHTARLIRDAGWEAILFAPGSYWAERGKRENVPVRSDLELCRGFHPLSFYRDADTLREFLRKEKPDVLVVQKSPEQWLAFLVLHFWEAPVALVRMRGVVFPIRGNLFNRWIHNGMERVICSANVIAEQYRQLHGFNQNIVTVLHEGVDTKRFTPATVVEKALARDKFKLEQRAFYIGAAGRPSPVKGHDLLIRAFAKTWPLVRPPTSNQYAPKDVRVVIFWDESRRGPGSYGDLGLLAKELKIEERVEFRPGLVEDMREVYHALDAFVLPSRGSEGSSRAGLEACAAGLPFIASSVGVLPDLVVNGETGRLIPPDSEEALQNALMELCEQWPKGHEWAKAARRRMEDEFREELYVDRLCKVLFEAAKSAKEKTA
jgi:glycosyltransferase involved in cell wall biosynthesis